MLQHDTADDYVLATGVTTTIREFINFAAAALEIDLAWEGEGLNETARDRASGLPVVEIDPQYFRPAEVDLLIGDAGKARDTLGWRPTVDVANLAAMMAKSDFDAVSA